MMNLTTLHAKRLADISNNAAVVVVTLMMMVWPLKTLAGGQQKPAEARSTATTESDATPAEHKKEVKAAPASTINKDKPGGVGANNRGRLVQEGIAIEYTVEPMSPGGEEAVLVGGDDARVQFRITDGATNSPITGLRPAAWLDYRETKQSPPEKECREKVRAFLQGSFGARPDVDLNSYYILALNKDPSISVIDPIVSFGSSKLLALISLNNPGEDWVLSRDGRKLFVTIPLSNQVAVVDTATWKVASYIESGSRPGRLILQRDQKYAWAGEMSATAAPSGVTVIDTATQKVAARIVTGTGRHDITLSADERFAFVSNSGEGTISIIDVQKLAKIKDLKIGATVTSLAYSSLSKTVYAVDETTGVMMAVDGQSHEVTGRLSFKPGVSVIRIAPGGRYGFILNTKESSAQVFDTASNKLLHTVEVGLKPDQIVFTQDYAYVRSLGSDQVVLLTLKDLDKLPSLQPTRIPAGQAIPETSGVAAAAEAIAATPEARSVLIANPADQTIYYYAEGMAAPMGNFQNYRRDPRGVMVVDRSIRETSPGVYSANIKLPQGGSYDLAFLLNSPRVINCFDISVNENPKLAKRDAELPLTIQYLVDSVNIRPHERVNLKFRLRDTQTGVARSDLKDVGVLTLAPGLWQERQWAKSLGDGAYEISFIPPGEGVYYVFVHCPSMKIKLNQLPFIVLDGRAPQ